METEDEQQQALNAAQLLKARPALKTDEWACSDAKCAFINNDKRNTCQACGKSKRFRRCMNVYLIISRTSLYLKQNLVRRTELVEKLVKKQRKNQKVYFLPKTGYAQSKNFTYELVRLTFF